MKSRSLSAVFAWLKHSAPRVALPFAEQTRESQWLQVLTVLAVASAAVLPIAIFGVPRGADLTNHLRFVVPFYEALKAGHYHPAWLAESNYGLGDLRFSVYPPGFYYLMAVLRMITGSWFGATVTTFLLLSATGGLGAYFWARSFLSPWLAVLAGTLYAIAPFRLNELYQASLLSEYAAGAILPFAFAFIDRTCRKKSSFDLFGLGAAYALLILTHLPLAVIGSIALALYALFRVTNGRLTDLLSQVRRRDIFRSMGRLAFGAAIGLTASSFFWISMLSELRWMKANSTQPNPYYDYRLNFLFSSAALVNRNTWYANLLSLVVIAFLLPGLVGIAFSFRSRVSRARLTAVVIVLSVTFLMATPLSRPLWAIIPKLSDVQFPWRWLSITTLMGALLVPKSLRFWQERFRHSIRARDLMVGLAFALSLYFIGSQIIYDTEYVGRESFETLTQEARGAVSFKDFLPIWASEFGKVEKMKERVDAGARTVVIKSWEPERRSFHVAAGPATTLRIRTYFYPRWIAQSEGQVLETNSSSDGLLQISVPPRATDVELTFERPSRIRIAELVSLTTWFLIFVSTLVWIIHLVHVPTQEKSLSLKLRLG